MVLVSSLTKKLWLRSFKEDASILDAQKVLSHMGSKTRADNFGQLGNFKDRKKRLLQNVLREENKTGEQLSLVMPMLQKRITSLSNRGLLIPERATPVSSL